MQLSLGVELEECFDLETMTWSNEDVQHHGCNLQIDRFLVKSLNSLSLQALSLYLIRIKPGHAGSCHTIV